MLFFLRFFFNVRCFLREGCTVGSCRFRLRACASLDFKIPIRDVMWQSVWILCCLDAPTWKLLSVLGSQRAARAASQKWHVSVDLKSWQCSQVAFECQYMSQCHNATSHPLISCHIVSLICLLQCQHCLPARNWIALLRWIRGGSFQWSSRQSTISALNQAQMAPEWQFHSVSMNSTESTESDAEPFCTAFAAFFDLVARPLWVNVLEWNCDAKWCEVMRSAYRFFFLNSFPCFTEAKEWTLQMTSGLQSVMQLHVSHVFVDLRMRQVDVRMSGYTWQRHLRMTICNIL